MGHQVSFFVMPADLPDLEAAIRAAGDVCFLTDESPTCEPVEINTITARPAAQSPRLRTHFIVQRQDLPAVSTRFVNARDCWLVEGVQSPVIEFSPGIFTGARLTRGRAYFATDQRFRSELASPNFVRWGDRVLTRVKAKLARHPELAPPWLYFGASALDWIQSSRAVMTGGAFAFTTSEGTHAHPQ